MRQINLWSWMTICSVAPACVRKCNRIASVTEPARKRTKPRESPRKPMRTISIQSYWRCSIPQRTEARRIALIGPARGGNPPVEEPAEEDLLTHGRGDQDRDHQERQPRRAIHLHHVRLTGEGFLGAGFPEAVVIAGSAYVLVL